MRYNVGTGWVIPWKRRADEPAVTAEEVFAHWTNDATDLSQSEPFFRHTPESRLLIGGDLKLTRNEGCPLRGKLDDFTSHLQNQNRLKFCGVKKPITERDSYTVTSQLSAFGMASVGDQEQFKISKGSSLREELIAKWTYEPALRNPAILANGVGVVVSACTENARRLRLVQILGSSTMRNYLETFLLEWEREDAREKYLEALASSDVRALEALYIQNPGIRKDLGRAIAVCLQALQDTGSSTSGTLNALWCPRVGEVWTATFNYWDKHWLGILKDTTTSCALTILVPHCLVLPALDIASACRTYPNTIEEFNSTANLFSTTQTHSTIFEKALAINEDATRPEGLVCDRRKWRVSRRQGHFERPWGLGSSKVHQSCHVYWKWSRKGGTHAMVQLRPLAGDCSIPARQMRSSSRTSPQGTHSVPWAHS
jgi:hypothetical protein